MFCCSYRWAKCQSQITAWPQAKFLPLPGMISKLMVECLWHRNSSLIKVCACHPSLPSPVRLDVTLASSEWLSRLPLPRNDAAHTMRH